MLNSNTLKIIIWRILFIDFDQEILCGRLKQDVDFEDYFVCFDGTIWSYKNKLKYKHDWLKIKPFKNKHGYLYVNFVDGKKKQKYAVHRLVAKYYCEGYFDGAVVNHKDGDKQNNHYKNLEWCTQRENVIKSYETSGINQVRNYKYYILEYPCGHKTEKMKSFKAVEQYIEENKLNTSANSLNVYGHSRGFKCIKLNK